MATRLHCHVQDPTVREGTCLSQGHDLRVRTTGGLCKTFADRLVILENDRPNRWIRADVTQSLLRQGQCLLHVVHVSLLPFVSRVVPVHSAGCGLSLPLIFAAQLWRSVQSLGRGRELNEGYLTDFHTIIERDGEIGDVA